MNLKDDIPLCLYIDCLINWVIIKHM